eukprot:6753020-Prymnesium_polylepis.1
MRISRGLTSSGGSTSGGEGGGDRQWMRSTQRRPISRSDSSFASRIILSSWFASTAGSIGENGGDGGGDTKRGA